MHPGQADEMDIFNELLIPCLPSMVQFLNFGLPSPPCLSTYLPQSGRDSLSLKLSQHQQIEGQPSHLCLSFSPAPLLWSDGVFMHHQHPCCLLSELACAPVIGTAVDFGFCASFTKSGRRCSSPINTAKGKHCEYHVKQEYLRVTSGRMELNRK